MSEYNSTYDDEEEISLSELFGHIFNHFKLIVIITLVFSIAGVCYALLTPKTYEVSAVVRLQEPTGAGVVRAYGGRSFSPTQAMYDVFSRSNMEIAIANTQSKGEVIYEDVIENLEYSAVSGTYNWKISIEKASDTDYWTELITNMVTPVMNEVVSYYTPDAESAIKQIESRISDYEAQLSTLTAVSSDDTDVRTIQNNITSLKNEIRNVEIYISLLPTAFEWVSGPEAGTKSTGTSRAVKCIVFFLVGGVIGVITSLVLGFTDKRVYNSLKLEETVDGRLVASVPLYTKGSALDEREFRYISEKLPLKKGDTLSIVTFTKNAGGKTFSEALKKETEAEVVNAGIIRENPGIITSVKNSTYTLVVLRAGFDTFGEIKKFDCDMKSLGIKNYGYVLNGVYYGDKNTTLYRDKKDYARHIWLLETWKSYYTKNSN